MLCHDIYFDISAYIHYKRELVTYTSCSNLCILEIYFSPDVAIYIYTKTKIFFINKKIVMETTRLNPFMCTTIVKCHAYNHIEYTPIIVLVFVICIREYANTLNIGMTNFFKWRTEAPTPPPPPPQKKLSVEGKKDLIRLQNIHYTSVYLSLVACIHTEMPNTIRLGMARYVQLNKHEIYDETKFQRSKGL